MYVKIFDSIIKSSIWDTDPETRITWITCLLLCDLDGNFTATRRYIAREANLPLERVEAALDILLNPDTDSTTPDDDGRRLDYCGNNTWHVVNYAKYNEIAKAETIREQTRKRVKLFSDRKKTPSVSLTQTNAELTQANEKLTPIPVAIPVTITGSGTPSISPVPGEGVESDPAQGKKKNPAPKPETVTLNRETFTLDNLTATRIETWTREFPGVDIDAELAAINAWCNRETAKALKVKQWSRFIDNWMQKALADKAAGKRPAARQTPIEHPHPFFDNKGVEFASAKAMRRIAEEEAAQAEREEANRLAIAEVM